MKTQSNGTSTIAPLQKNDDRGQTALQGADGSNRFGYGPHMIAQQGGGRTRGDKRVEQPAEKERGSQSNRFDHLMSDDPGNLQESLQVMSHNSPTVAIKYNSIQSKK